MAEAELSLLAAGVTDIGPKEQNEDSWFIQPTRDGGQLLMLTDGMGGMGRGQEASETALHALAERLVANDDPAYDAIISGFNEADARVKNIGVGDQGRQPGTTAAIAYVQSGRVTVGWVGDSTILLVRDGRVLTQNRSHRLVQKLIDDGLMTEESAKSSPMARLLERSLGGRDEDDAVKPGLLERWTLRPGDYVILCSDGLTDSIPAKEIPGHLQGSDVSSLARTLVEAAKERGIDDNTTVIVATVVEGEVSNRVGDCWTAEGPEYLSLPPTAYRSGIVNADAIAMMTEGGLAEPDAAEAAQRRMTLMLALAIGALVLLLGVGVTSVMLLLFAAG